MNRLIVGLVIFSLTFSTHAGVIGDELKKLGASFTENFSSSDPGSFVSKSRSGFSGGTIRKRIERTTVTPISITPPKLTTGGCAGIDIHFGSFSYINGDQIRQLLSSYLQGVVGLAFTMAIDQGCPECGKAMDKMSELANYANGMNLDSCAMAQGTMDAIFDEKAEACASNAADSGSSDDRSQSKETGGSCGSDKSPDQIAEELSNQLNCSGKTGDELTKCEQNRTKLLKLWGNTTVHFLKQSGVLSDNNSWDDHDTWKASLYTSTMGAIVDGTWYEPSVTPIEVMEAALCGINPIPQISSGDNEIEKTVIKELNDQCAPFIMKVNNADNPLQITHCTSATCNLGETWTFKEWVESNQNLMGAGYPFSPNGLLRTVGEAIVSMQDKAKTGTASFTPYEAYLLDTAPFPLYRLINISSFYPNAATEILGKNTQLLAFEYARGITESFFDGILSSRALIPDDAEGRVLVPKELSDDIRQRATRFKFEPGEYASKDDAAYRMNTIMVQQIISLEKSLLQSNLNKGLNGLGIN